MADDEPVSAFGPFTGLPDLTELSAVDLDNPQIRAALDRVRRQLEDPDGVISAFQSFTS